MWGKQQVTIGIDLGGTKIAVAAVDATGTILFHKLLPTEKNPTQLIEQITAMVLEAEATLSNVSVKGIGLASAGPLNVETGNLIYPTNFPEMKVFPLIERLKQSLASQNVAYPIHFQNDAMAAALGEGWVGGAQRLQTFVVVTVGTGIGTGVIFQGKPVQNLGMGGEFGIQLIDYNGIRKKGIANISSQSVEGIASGTAICARAKRKGFKGETIQELMQTIAHGDGERYLTLFQDAALALAILCYNLSLGFNPGKILFTGGVMHARKYFFAELRDYYKQLTAQKVAFRSPIALAKLSYKAGVIGAARLPLL